MMTQAKPKRPLSAYNLFYRFKRSKILEAHESGDGSKETINRLLLAAPGLEHLSAVENIIMTPQQLRERQRSEIRSTMSENLCPTDTSARSHRKSHGCMSFVEMNRVMCVSWKSVDRYIRGVFEELAAEGRLIYKERIAEYGRNNRQHAPEEEEVKPGSSSVAIPRISQIRKPKTKKAEAKPSSRAPKPAPSKSTGASDAGEGKPHSKPKRPLSAYNLFYRFKRTKALEMVGCGNGTKEAIGCMIAAPPGLERFSSAARFMLSPEQARSFCRAEIRSALLENLSPTDTAGRSHRKSHGCMSFLEMSNLVCASWKSIDSSTKSVFEELADEGRGMYHKRVLEYYGTALETPPKKKSKSITLGRDVEFPVVASAPLKGQLSTEWSGGAELDVRPRINVPEGNNDVVTGPESNGWPVTPLSYAPQYGTIGASVQGCRPPLDFIFNAPNFMFGTARGGTKRTPPHNVTPSMPSRSTCLGTTLEAPPFCHDIMTGLEESSGCKLAPRGYASSSQALDESDLSDIPPLPHSRIEENELMMRENASEDDFMKVIEVLDV